MIDEWARMLDEATRHPRWETVPEPARRAVVALLESYSPSVEWIEAVLATLSAERALMELLPRERFDSLAQRVSLLRESWPGPAAKGPPMLNWRCGEPGCPTHDYGDRYAPYVLERCPAHERPLERTSDD